MNNIDEYKHVWEVIQNLLIISHGQVSIERVFSANKEVTDVNMQENTLVSLRVIKDYIRYIGGLQNVVVTKKLHLLLQAARTKYQIFLDSKQSENEKKTKAENRKNQEVAVDDLRKRSKVTESEIELLVADADAAAETAEHKRSVFYITKSNALRRRAKEKEEEFKLLRKHLDKKKLLKNT